MSTRLAALAARRIAASEVVLAAAPHYLARHGAPRTLQCVRDHQVLEVTTDGGHAGGLRVVGSASQELESIRANSAEALKGFAVAGLGLIRSPAFVVADELADGRLVRVLADAPLGEYAVTVVFPHRTMMPVRLRRLMDHLSRGLASLSRDGHAVQPYSRRPAPLAA